jgi:hypothetical protein
MLFTRARGKSRLGTGSPGLRLVWARRTGQVDPRPRRYKTGGSPASRDRSLWRLCRGTAPTAADYMGQGAGRAVSADPLVAGRLAGSSGMTVNPFVREEPAFVVRRSAPVAQRACAGLYQHSFRNYPTSGASRAPSQPVPCADDPAFRLRCPSP